MQTTWYEDFFQGLAVELWGQAIPPEATAAEVDFLTGALRVPPGGRILDVPCGLGRHALELARRGYRMTGVDLSEESLARARASAAAEGLEIDWVRGDMRRLPRKRAAFDGAFCFGNSFGYLEYADMEAFLKSVARALRPGARFVVETGMAAESILPRLVERESFQVGDIRMTVDSRYRAEDGCVEERITFERGGEVEVRPSVHWVYTAAEIRRMLERAGFSVVSVYGSLDLEPFSVGGHELFVVAEKPRSGAPAV
jgi:SAM-dependent methyltransferase